MSLPLPLLCCCIVTDCNVPVGTLLRYDLSGSWAAGDTVTVTVPAVALGPGSSGLNNATVYDDAGHTATDDHTVAITYAPPVSNASVSCNCTTPSASGNLCKPAQILAMHILFPVAGAESISYLALMPARCTLSTVDAAHH